MLLSHLCWCLEYSGGGVWRMLRLVLQVLRKTTNRTQLLLREGTAAAWVKKRCPDTTHRKRSAQEDHSKLSGRSKSPLPSLALQSSLLEPNKSQLAEQKCVLQSSSTMSQSIEGWVWTWAKITQQLLQRAHTQRKICTHPLIEGWKILITSAY